jgi:hypothetical protein
MSDHDHDCECNKCCPGPIGPQGFQGPQGNQGPAGSQGPAGISGSQGIQGVQGNDGQPGPMGPVGPLGPQGLNGLTGATGAQGPQGNNGLDGAQGPLGPQGPQGPQGLQGPKGDCVECHCDHVKPEYAQLYSDQTQNLAPSLGANLAGGVVTFDNVIVATSNIDTSLAATTGAITINRKGWYRIDQAVDGTLNPLSAPLIAWGLAIFRNGLFVPGSMFVDMTISPDQQANETSASLMMLFNAGDSFTLNNMCIQNLLLGQAVGGVNSSPNSAAINIELVEAL